MAQKIIPCLWFDKKAAEAVNFYTSVFPRSATNTTTFYPLSEEEGLADFQKDLAGDVLTIDFTLAGHSFLALNAGPEFAPTSALSFLVNFDPSTDDQALDHLNQAWDKLIQGGEALIDIGEHPFSKRYGWVKDKYGFSWQLMLTNPQGEPRPTIIPDFLFGADVQNRAEEAMTYYADVFDDTKVNVIARYPADQPPVIEGAVMFGEFSLAGQWFAAMDSAVDQDTSFNEAVSLIVNCKDQKEIDALWAKLSAVPEAEQCGWCKDKFGVSWQVVPENMEALLRRPDAFTKMMQMKKLVIGDF